MKSLRMVVLLILSVFGGIQLLGSTQSNRPPAQTPHDDSKTPDFFDEAPVPPPVPPISTGRSPSSLLDFSHDAAATFHGHGDHVCASGCALSRHPTEPLAIGAYRELLAESSTQAFDADNLAFETLLFFGRQTNDLIRKYGTPQLSKSQSARLTRELQRQHAQVSIRMMDQNGRRRSWINDVRVPLDRRHVFEMQTHGVQSLVTSGTVKRVGLHHLWTRL